MSCTSCFEAILKPCPSTIELTAGLAADTDYFWVLSKGRRIYQKKVATDSAGKLVIDCSVLPDGLLNPHAGLFFLEIRAGDNYTNIISLTGDYTCILIQFVDVEGDAGINNLINIAA